PNAVVRRAVFKHGPVIELYEIELSILFNRLISEESLDRDDPNLFDKELDAILAKWGPEIWPQPRHGTRDHLRKPEKGTRYTSDLVYPRDSIVLKRHLRGIILGKQRKRAVDI